MYENNIDYLFVSDLHLSLGVNPESGALHPEEAFFYDPAFARLLQHHLDAAARESRQLRLVLLGDIFDLRLIADEHQDGLPGLSIDNTLRKLDQIAAGHPLFVQALTHLLETGASIDIVPGNHDIELIFPVVHEHLRRLLSPRGDQPSQGRLNFYPWFYYQPGLFYAEHGQQWQGFNIYPNLLQCARAGHPDCLQLPYGYTFDLLLYDLARATSPELDHGPSLFSIKEGLKKRPWRIFAAPPLFARATAMLAHEMKARYAQRRQPGAAEALDFYAALAGLPTAILVRLASLTPTSAWQSTYSLLRKFVESFDLTPHKRYLLAAARKIHSILQSEQAQVPFYIFGHDHHPGKTPLGPGAAYLNCGTWVHHNTWHDPHAPVKFPYVIVRTGASTDGPSADFYWWNEGSRLDM